MIFVQDAGKVAFVPWLPELLLGSGFLGVGALPVVLFWGDATSRPVFLAICMTSCMIGLLFLGRVWARYRGTLVEKRAVRRLRLPEGWKARMNVQVKHGDLDLLIEDPGGVRYAVEIKSYQGIRLQRGTFRNKEELRYRDGRAFSRDPVEQVLRAAEELDARPLIWLPEARSAKVLRMKCGVQVVQGNGKNLMKVVGARSRWF